MLRAYGLLLSKGRGEGRGAEGGGENQLTGTWASEQRL